MAAVRSGWMLTLMWNEPRDRLLCKQMKMSDTMSWATCPQKQTLRQGCGCKWFTPANTGCEMGKEGEPGKGVILSR